MRPLSLALGQHEKAPGDGVREADAGRTNLENPRIAGLADLEPAAGREAQGVQELALAAVLGAEKLGRLADPQL
jgi:hypothetical protein